MTKHLGLLIILAFLALGPAISPAALAQDADKKTVNVVVLPGTQLFPISVMQLRGLDRKHDIKIKEELVPGVQGMFVRAANLDFHVMFMTWTNVPMLRAKGVDVVNVFATSNFSHDIFVRTDSPIKSWKDLKGKTVGLPGNAAATSTQLFRYEMKKFLGIAPDEFQARFAAPGLLATQLERGDIDASLLHEPVASKFLASGKYRSIGGLGDAYKAATGKTPPPYVVVVFNGAWAKSNPDVAKRFLAALKDSLQLMAIDAEVWPELAAKVHLTEKAEADMLRKRVGGAVNRQWTAQQVDAQKEIMADMVKVLSAQELGAFPAQIQPEAYTMDYAPH